MVGDVKIQLNGGIHLGGLKDLSEGGLAVTTSTPYEVGYEMFVSIELSGSLKSVAAVAQVVWVHPLKAAFHTTGMGLKFLALKEEDYYRLNEVLELA